MKWRCLPPLCLLTLLPIGEVLAMRADAGVGVRAEYSDNIALVPGKGESAWVGVALGRLHVREHSSAVDARVLGEAQYRNYQTRRYDNEWVVGLDAVSDWHLTSGLSWRLEDYFHKRTTNLFAPPTPSNRENTNVFSTGPEQRWRIAPNHSFVLGARAGDFWFEKTDADSKRLSGYGRWQWMAASSTELALNGELTDVTYASSRWTDYRRGDGFLRLTRHWARTTLQTDLGATRIQRDVNGDVNGFLGRVALDYTPNSSSGVDLFVMHEYTDPGHDILALAGRGGDIGLLDEQVTGDIFYVRHVQAGYRHEGVRSRWRIAATQRSEDYQTTPRDRDYSDGYMEFGYDLSATLESRLIFRYRRADYREAVQVDTDRHAGFALDYRATPRLTATLELLHGERDSTLPSASFKENRVLISLIYQPSTFDEE